MFLFLFSYFSVKYIAYTCWCLVANKKFHLNYSNQIVPFFGLIRLLIGICFGAVLYVILQPYIATDKIIGQSNVARLYTIFLYIVIIYLPLQWLEWSLQQAMMEKSINHFLRASSKVAVKWRLGGIAISCFFDIPGILLGGMLIGFC